MEIIGYICALIIGLSLGLIGGGGSILTVPVMVYLFGISPVLATAYSLFIVGVSALFGAYKNIQSGLINYRVAIVFAIPSFITVFLTRLYLVPWIPDVIYSTETFVVTKSLGIMVLFALVMLLAAWSMIRSGKTTTKELTNEINLNIPVIILEGVLVGIVTGLVGAGGGFLIIPVLVLFVGLSMKQAVGTSLLIITVKSLIGFTGDLGASQNIDWMFLLSFSTLAVVGILLGVYLSKYISGKKLKAGFGWFVLIMAIYILTKELLMS